MPCVSGHRMFAVVFLTLLLAAGFAAADPPAYPLPTVSDPVSAGNLSIYLLRGPSQDAPNFLLLQDGLSSGEVVVNEQPNPTTTDLQIENRSDRPLLLQTGDRLEGGHQDRTCSASFVIPPHSGAVSLPAFCIEPSRGNGPSPKFNPTRSCMLAPESVRVAAAVQRDQRAVWDAVGRVKRVLAGAMAASDTTSSLNETWDDPHVLAAADRYTDRLSKLVLQQPDAVGVAFAVDGTLREIDVYPNHALLAEVYPQLLGSQAVDAAVRATQRKPTDARCPAPPPARSVAEMMSERPRHVLHDGPVNARSSVNVTDLAGWFRCTATYDTKPVQQQWLRADPGPSGESLPRILSQPDTPLPAGLR